MRLGRQRCWKCLRQEQQPTTSSNNAKFEDMTIVLHGADGCTTSKGEGHKQDRIATNDMIGKFFFFFNNNFFNSYLNTTTTTAPSDANMNNNFFFFARLHCAITTC